QIERAGAVAGDGLRVAKHFGDGYHAGWFQAEEALFAFFRGDWDSALAGTQTFLEGLGERKHYMVGPVRLLRGRLLAERGDTAGGLAEAGAALDYARLVQDPQQLFPALTWNALILIRAGRPSEAVALLDEAFECAF